jgi:iron complex transport system ATP-binding protein
LARALAVEAPLLLVDEPTASLDPFHQLGVMTVLRNYAAGQRVVIAVLHDLALAARFCHRLLLMCGGSLVGDGQPDAVLNSEALRRHYDIEAYVARHEGQLAILPWRRIS